MTQSRPFLTARRASSVTSLFVLRPPFLLVNALHCKCLPHVFCCSRFVCYVCLRCHEFLCYSIRGIGICTPVGSHLHVIGFLGSWCLQKNCSSLMSWASNLCADNLRVGHVSQIVPRCYTNVDVNIILARAFTNVSVIVASPFASSGVRGQ